MVLGGGVAERRRDVRRERPRAPRPRALGGCGRGRRWGSLGWGPWPLSAGDRVPATLLQALHTVWGLLLVHAGLEQQVHDVSNKFRAEANAPESLKPTPRERRRSYTERTKGRHAQNIAGL